MPKLTKTPSVLPLNDLKAFISSGEYRTIPEVKKHFLVSYSRAYERCVEGVELGLWECKQTDCYGPRGGAPLKIFYVD